MTDDNASAEMLSNRLRKRQKHLRKWAKRTATTCYRVYDRDIPELPLVIDWYDGRLHVAEYARPHDRSPAAHDAWLEALVTAAAEVMGVPLKGCFLKRRERQRGTSQYERFDGAGAVFQVQEGGLTLEVNLSDYLDTGLFLDHRNTRAKVCAASPGRHVLNLYAYTGAFSVHAASGGALSTTTVDMSRTYLDWASRNLRHNGFKVGKDHHLIQADVLPWLADEAGRGMYDLVVLDPPTFSNSKRMHTHFDIQNDQLMLLRAVAAITRPGGHLVLSTNFRKFKPAFEQSLGHLWSGTEITNTTIPEDFRNKRIHRCWWLERQPN